MRITASQIVDWANTNEKEAQQLLPRLIRRLCYANQTLKHVSFPAGDSTYVPGWDGVVHAKEGNAWVPGGDSLWEIGCDKNVTSKANRDYKKRTEKTEEDIRMKSAYLFVTPRRWTQKEKWIEQRLDENRWADVRIYDADDLEQWLEQSPAASIQFAEEIGLAGWGVMSSVRYWENWAKQCEPNIQQAQFIGNRNTIQDKLKEIITGALSQKNSITVAVRADSVEEGAAFVASTIIAMPGVAEKTLVVTEPEGWEYIAANQGLRVAVAASTEVASKAIVRQGLLLLVPHAIGDMAGKIGDNEIVLERPDIYGFEKALSEIGVEESDAKRFAANSGRSWTIFRRQKSTNPALRNPAWLETSHTNSLSVLCLINAWNGSKQEDRQIIEKISGCKYEEIERDLYNLSACDDSPVLHIGQVWRAKSALEFLILCGGRIPSEQIDRFFDVAISMLSTPDPQLELPEEERWMAQVHGKVHPYSGLLFESVCDSIMKLGSRGSEFDGLSTLHIEERIAQFVEELLADADEVRWLSLASYLPTLAEAAPDVFLKAVENSLRSEEMSVTKLITETGESSFMGRCWHSGLLWALEKLAWSPRRVSRVAMVLAKLTHIPMKGNWGNTPISSLHGIVRSWFPQTAADLTGRIQVLDLLIENEPNVAFNLLQKILSKMPHMASPANRPEWRDDDAGVGHGVTEQEHIAMLVAAKERILRISEHNAERIASLIKNTVLGHGDKIESILQLIEPFLHAGTNDHDLEVIRAALRDVVHWHRNYDESVTNGDDSWLKTVESFYEYLAPENSVLRHCWLFNEYWIELPSRHRDDVMEERQDAVINKRTNAVEEIAVDGGVPLLNDLICTCGEPVTVGQAIARSSIDGFSLFDWIKQYGNDFDVNDRNARFLSGYIQSLDTDSQILSELIISGRGAGWKDEKIAKLITLARPERSTWNLLETYNKEIRDAYWKTVRPGFALNDDDMNYVMRHLYAVERPVTALWLCQHSLDKVSARTIYDLLMLLLQGKELNGRKLDSWRLGKIIQHLERSGEIDKMELVQLEFAMFPAFRGGDENYTSALFSAITTEPALFNELIRYAYKSEHGDGNELSDAEKSTAETAYWVLRQCKRVPGSQEDGSVDEEAMIAFANAVFTQGMVDGRLKWCEYVLGEILAHSNPDKEGAWPDDAICKLLDLAELEEMRRGFSIGTFNKRGVTTRAPTDGGEQERELAKYYRKQAERVQHKFPNVAMMLEEIAKDYEYRGKREDDEAGLTKEGF